MATSLPAGSTLPETIWDDINFCAIFTGNLPWLKTMDLQILLWNTLFILLSDKEG